jgi:glucose dehydrogenase
VSAPLLIDVQRNGRTIHGLVHPGRDGYLWLLERSAQGIAFVDAKPYVTQNVFTKLDPKTGRPEYDLAHKPAVGHRATYCPSLWGGKDWPPAAYSPKTGYLYIPANDNLCAEMEGDDEVEYRRGQQFTGATTTDFRVTEGADHIGELQAWNLKTGERAWTQKFESPNWGPVLATAGGVIFEGGTSDVISALSTRRAVNSGATARTPGSRACPRRSNRRRATVVQSVRASTRRACSAARPRAARTRSCRKAASFGFAETREVSRLPG